MTKIHKKSIHKKSIHKKSNRVRFNALPTALSATIAVARVPGGVRPRAALAKVR